MQGYYSVYVGNAFRETTEIEKDFVLGYSSKANYIGQSALKENVFP